MQWRNVVALLFLSFGLVISACVPTSGSEPLSTNQAQETAVVPVTPMSGTFVVVADVAVARTGPSLEATILASFNAGDMVQVSGLAGAGTWYRVVTDQGEGWIVTSFLAQQPTATVSQTKPAPAPTQGNQEPTQTASLTPTICVGAPSGWVQYVVQSGNTLSLLAISTGTTVAELRQANCMAPSNNTIFVGSKLWIPRLPQLRGALSPETPTVTVTVIATFEPPPPDTPTPTNTAIPTFEPPPRVIPTNTRSPAP